jgi:hypothetical protein
MRPAGERFPSSYNPSHRQQSIVENIDATPNSAASCKNRRSCCRSRAHHQFNTWKKTSPPPNSSSHPPTGKQSNRYLSRRSQTETELSALDLSRRSQTKTEARPASPNSISRLVIPSSFVIRLPSRSLNEGWCSVIVCLVSPVVSRLPSLPLRSHAHSAAGNQRQLRR